VLESAAERIMDGGLGDEDDGMGSVAPNQTDGRVFFFGYEIVSPRTRLADQTIARPNNSQERDDGGKVFATQQRTGCTGDLGLQVKLLAENACHST
jgi:hypothetical protein